MLMDPPTTTRLHVSGLTPQISVTDLATRFSTFGTVIALDEHGKVDGVGRPRPYAYVTLRTTKPQLSKCLNLLSGTTWKGARLRIGEAKPDFRERIAQELAPTKRPSDASDSIRPLKRRRLMRGCHGRHAADMSLVTPTNASARAGWRKTPMGRLIRPMRMRPARPLPVPEPVQTRAKKAGFKKERKSKPARIMTRARRRTIDPTRWKSEYLRGMLLQAGHSIVRGRNGVTEDEGLNDMGEEEDVEDILIDEPHVSSQLPSPQAPAVHSPSPPPTGPPAPSSSPPPSPPISHRRATVPVPSDTVDFSGEAEIALALLNNLFDGRVDEDWVGQESLSDIDVDEACLGGTRLGPSDPDDVEVVPRTDAFSAPIGKGQKSAELVAGVTDTGIQPAEAPAEHAPKPSAKTSQMIKLKDLFAPRAEQATFSLLGNFDIDLELDDALDIACHTPVPPTRAPTSRPQAHAPAFSSTPAPHAPVNLDTSQPLFFPLAAGAPRARARDVCDAFAARGWGMSSGGFHRTEGADEVRERWEAAKAELTREWKRRHREALKSARRRRGGAGAVAEL